MDSQAAYLSFRLASATTLILLLFSVPVAHWLAFGKSRWRLLIEATVALPLVLPPTVLGYYLLVLMAPSGSPGRVLMRLFGRTLAFSFPGLLIGSLIFSLPFAVQPITAGFRAVDAEIIDAAEMLSTNRRKILLKVLLPLIRPSLLTAAVLAFTHTLGEFGVVLMIGGGIPGATRTLSISLYDQVQDFAYAAADRTAFLLVSLSFLALIFIYGRRGREHA
jgi:molybdate transport system permease protein